VTFTVMQPATKNAAALTVIMRSAILIFIGAEHDGQCSVAQQKIARTVFTKLLSKL
jgi:hypothetical protein